MKYRSFILAIFFHTAIANASNTEISFFGGPYSPGTIECTDLNGNKQTLQINIGNYSTLIFNHVCQPLFIKSPKFTYDLPSTAGYCSGADQTASFSVRYDRIETDAYVFNFEECR